jgi:hypothetical protein
MLKNKQEKMLINIKIKRITISILFLFLSLTISRFLDFCVIWKLMAVESADELSFKLENELDNTKTEMKREFRKRLNVPAIEFVYLGFSSFHNANRILSEKVRENHNKIIAVSYFNLKYPCGFLINHEGEGSVFEEHFIGKLEKGLTEIYFYKNDKTKIKHKNKIREANIAILGEQSSWTFYNEDKHIFSSPIIDLEKSYSKLVFFIYFYFPFFIITALSLIKRHSIFVSFFFFFEMSFLFGTANILKNSHFYLAGQDIVIPVLLFLLILIGFLFGLYSLIKDFRKNVDFVNISIIVYFLFLPIFLRY